VSDQDFNFRPPVERREAKPFEPPPWEKPQFDELERRRVAEQEAAARRAAEQAEAENLAADVVASMQPAAAEPDASAALGEIAAPKLDAAPASAPVAAEHGGVTPIDSAASLDEKRVAAMLMVLQAEEPPAFAGVWKVALGASALSAVLGLVLTVWGVVALVKFRAAGVTGMVGGMALLLFGIGFTAVGAWIGFKALREQGVL